MDTPNGNDGSSFQPEPQFVISALQEELAAANANRLYLVASIKQLQNVIAQINANYEQERELWQIEKASLIASSPEE